MEGCAERGERIRGDTPHHGRRPDRWNALVYFPDVTPRHLEEADALYDSSSATTKLWGTDRAQPKCSNCSTKTLRGNAACTGYRDNPRMMPVGSYRPVRKVD
jgi:hypothetical protein